MEIIPVIFNFVKMIDKKDIPGEEKKKLLYKSLFDLWGHTKYEEYKPYIDYCLETIIFISKTHLISNINQNSIYKKNCGCF